MRKAKEPDIRNWFGGLVDGMRDGTGQMYMRNRYYDPATGQFTQPDPIGLAGGLNSYGFAAADPVTYSDPYGLSAEEADPPGWFHRLASRTRQLILPAAASAVVQGETLVKNAPESMTPPPMEERVVRSGSGETTRRAQTPRPTTAAPPGGGGGGPPSGAGGGASSGSGAARFTLGRVLAVGGVVLGIALSPDPAGSDRPAVCDSEGQCLYQD